MSNTSTATPLLADAPPICPSAPRRHGPNLSLRTAPDPADSNTTSHAVRGRAGNVTRLPQRRPRHTARQAIHMPTSDWRTNSPSQKMGLAAPDRSSLTGACTPASTLACTPRQATVRAQAQVAQRATNERQQAGCMVMFQLRHAHGCRRQAGGTRHTTPETPRVQSNRLLSATPPSPPATGTRRAVSRALMRAATSMPCARSLSRSKTRTRRCGSANL